MVAAAALTQGAHALLGSWTGSSLKGINTYPTCVSHEERCKAAGFSTAHTATMAQFYSHLVTPEERLATLAYQRAR